MTVALMFSSSTDLASHRIRINLTHVRAGVVRLNVSHVQLPCVMAVVSDGQTRIVRHHVSVNSQNRPRIRLYPGDLRVT